MGRSYQCHAPHPDGWYCSPITELEVWNLGGHVKGSQGFAEADLNAPNKDSRVRLTSGEIKPHGTNDGRPGGRSSAK